MAFTRLTALLLVLSPSLTQASGASLLQRGANRQRTFAGLRYSPQDPAARTLLTLDTNHDGSISPSEIAAFAQDQGLDAAAATQEFTSIDANGDGVLDSSELLQVLGGGGHSKEAAAATQVVEEPPLATAPEAEVVEEAPLAAAEPPLVPAKATKERLVSSEPVTAHVDTATILSEADTATSLVDTQLISDESRNSVRAAAQKVSQELEIEETEENAARKLERKAAAIRANSTALAKAAIQDALDAGEDAAHVMADKLMKKITDVEDQAERAEVRAAALRAKSKMELEEGNQLMAAADKALKQQD